MNSVVYCLLFGFVSPSDPTLTVENVREVMAEVRDWERDVRTDSGRKCGDVRTDSGRK